MGKRRVVSNLLIMAIGQMITWIVSIGHLVLVSRYLGPLRLGEFVLASSFTTMLGLVLGLGMDTYITRAIARTPERGNVIVSAALAARGTLACLVPLAIYLYSQIAHLNPETIAAAYILGLGMVMQQFSGVMVAAFQGHERMSLGTIGNVTFNVAQLGLTGLAIVLHGSIINFAVNNAVLTLVVLLLNLNWARKIVQPTRQITVRDVTEVVRGSFAFCAGNLFQTLYASIDSVILGFIAGNRPVAFYGSANRLLTIPMVFPYLLGSATLPMLSRLGLDPKVDFERTARKTLSLLITCSVPLAIGMASMAGPGISIIFGPAFSEAVPVLTILSLTVPLTFLDMQFYQILAAQNREIQWTRIMGVSCAVNPLVNVALIPLSIHQWHNGAIGAALSLLVTEGIMTIYGASVLRRVVLHPLIGHAVLASLAAGAVQALILKFTGPQPLLLLFVAEGLAAAAYLVLVVAFGALPRQDVIYLWRTALRRPQGATT